MKYDTVYEVHEPHTDFGQTISIQVTPQDVDDVDVPNNPNNRDMGDGSRSSYAVVQKSARLCSRNKVSLHTLYDSVMMYVYKSTKG